MSGTLAGTLGAILGTGATGGWAERFLRPASLRGRGFWVTTGDDETARRWVTHEFPGRDDPWHEDLGAKVRGFELAGLLIGDDVLRQVERLRAAAGATGPARLVHPWYGTMDVVVLSCTFSLDAGEGRVARFRLRLERAGTKPAPTVTPGLIGRMLAAAEAAMDALDDVAEQVQGQVAALRQVIGLPDQLIGSVVGIAGGLAGVAQRGITGSAIVNTLGGTVAGQAIAALASLSPAEAADPATTSQRIGAVADAIAAEATPAAGGNQPLAALLAIAAQPVLVAVPVDRSTPLLAAIADQAAFLAASARLQFATAAATASATAAWDSREAALAARDSLAAALETAAEEMTALGHDGAWRTTLALRTAVIADVTERAAILPRIRRLPLPAALPASLVAFGMDPDALATAFARGTDIAGRNAARHPGFLTGTIEVLT